MYTKVHKKGDQWFRDDGTLVGNTVDTYFYTYHGLKLPIIKALDGFYIRPVWGRVDQQTQKFVPLCEGMNTKLCTGPFCKAYSDNPIICPRYKGNNTEGYYILSD